MSSQLNELRLQLERLDYDSKESVIMMDILKEQNQDATRELEELRKALADLKTNNQREASAEEKEKKKRTQNPPLPSLNTAPAHLSTTTNSNSPSPAPPKWQ